MKITLSPSVNMNSSSVTESLSRGLYTCVQWRFLEARGNFLNAREVLLDDGLCETSSIVCSVLFSDKLTVVIVRDFFCVYYLIMFSLALEDVVLLSLPLTGRSVSVSGSYPSRHLEGFPNGCFLSCFLLTVLCRKRLSVLNFFKSFASVSLLFSFSFRPSRRIFFV